MGKSCPISASAITSLLIVKSSKFHMGISAPARHVLAKFLCLWNIHLAEMFKQDINTNDNCLLTKKQDHKEECPNSS